MSWRFFLNDGTVSGTKVSGDPTVPRTRWWNHLLLLWFWWKKVTVFQVPLEVTNRGFCIGFIPEKGKPMIKTDILHEWRFRVRNGREDCIFFALPANSDMRPEIPLAVVTQTTKDNRTYADLPLY